MTFTLSSQQDAAMGAVLDWFTLRQRPVFRLFGYAGSGKTSIARTLADAIAERTGKQVLFAAYTGKAASVLRSKGCQATTIHGLIYKPRNKDCIAGGPAPCPICGTPFFRPPCTGCGFEKEPEIAAPKPNPDTVEFDLHGASLRNGKVALIIIDECSMVGEKIGLDLLSFGVPVLVLGDPAQLPPIGDGGYFTNGTPDVMLTEIHRQKEGCGILDIATAVRTGQQLVHGKYSESQVLPLFSTRDVDPFAYDQVIVGRNDTRRSWNNKMRTALGRTTQLPEPGDKLICLRNNHQKRIVNGEQVTCVSSELKDEWTVNLVFDRGNGPEECIAGRHYFDGRPGNPDWTGDVVLYFDFGYAITGHKSQGSQWPRVLVVNESRVFREDAAKWLYTAVTRSSEHVTVLG